MTDTVVTANSFTTFKTMFSTTLIQAEASLYSEIFDAEIDFVWCTADIAMGNAAFLKVKFFLEEVLHQSICTHKDATIKLSELNNKIVMFPYVPTSDIIAMTLHAKLNTIADGYIDIISVKITSKFENPTMSYTYADEDYPGLPNLEKWIGQKEYYYKDPWWFRQSPETIDYEVDEETDLTTPPEYDNVLEEIQQVVLGELKLVDDPGEVIKIHDWQPKIVED
ncbi:hypothetical protein N9I00_01160 [bacterium]|nr:hypothetical protein [bacterium]